MKSIVAIRCSGILLLTLALLLIPVASFKPLFVSMLFGHYFLSVLYAKNKITYLGREKKTWSALFFLSLISVFYFTSGAYKPLQILFTVMHIALSDTYMANEVLQDRFSSLDGRIKSNLNLSRFFLNTFVFMLLFQSAPIINLFPVYAIESGVFLSLIAFIFWIAKLKPTKTAISFALYELSATATAFVLIFLKIPIQIQFLVFYHVIIWVIYPAFMQAQRKNQNEMAKYLGWVVSSSLFFLILRLTTDPSKSFFNLDQQIPFWASVHFISTLALSKFNPKFVVNLFTPKYRIGSQTLPD